MAGLALSGLFSWLALRGTDVSQVAASLLRADLASILWATALSYVVLWVRSMRWRLLLSTLGKTSTASVFKASLIGYMVNYLLPIRIGEVVRAYLVGTHGEFSRSAAMATVVVERIIDVLSILVIFACISPIIQIPVADEDLMDTLRTGTLALALAGVGALVSVLLFRRHARRLATLAESLLGRVAPAMTRQLWRIPAFAEGLQMGWGFKGTALLTLYTLLIWALTVAQIVLLAEGFAIELPWAAGWLMLVALAVGVSVPSAPGMIGTFHYAAIVVLLLYGVARADAVSYAIALHAVSVFPILILGLAVTWLGGMSLRRLVAVGEAETATQR